MQRAEIRITPIDRGEAPRIASLWIEAGDLHASLDPHFALSDRATRYYEVLVRKAIADPSYRVRAARHGVSDEIVGFHLSQIVTVQPVFRLGRAGYISDLVVAPDHRRCGVATLLGRDALDWFRERKVSTAQIQVLSANGPAEAFWRERMGFADYMDRLWLDL